MTADENVNREPFIARRIQEDFPRLESDSVHIWSVRLGEDEGSLRHLAGVLSADEGERAARFVQSRHRWRWTAARGWLRILLGRYLEQPPAVIRFSLSPHGKPGLADRDSPLRFNLSHSDERALYAFSLGRSLGIDIERHRPEMACEEIANRFFAASEAASLIDSQAVCSVRAFFDCWTRKEAFVKALGLGLSYPLDKFQVSTLPEDQEALLKVEKPSPIEVGCLRDLQIAPNWSAALAVEGRPERFEYYRPLESDEPS